MISFMTVHKKKKKKKKKKHNKRNQFLAMQKFTVILNI